VHKRQKDSYERILKCVTHLIYLLVETASSENEKAVMYQIVCALVKQNPRSIYTEDTLLHLCVSSLNTINSTYFSSIDDIHVSTFFFFFFSFEMRKTVKRIISIFLLSIIIFYNSVESFPVLDKNGLKSRILSIAFLKFNSREKLILNRI